MIYLITGVPGSGKTLYAVSTLIKSLMKDKVKDSSGKMVDRRLVVDGIPALTIPHETMANTLVEDKTITVVDGGQGVGNWFDWCRPGDVIVIDEVQRIWRPRAMGTKPPKMITELETHRHKGVDLILITQNPMLIDQNVRRLVGRHQHVRRLWGMARALIYDWDGCQADVHRVASANKTMWAYPKDAYKLYASSEAHTKQKQAFPVWVALPILALVGAVLVGPKAWAVMSGAVSGKGISQSKPADSVAVTKPSESASAPVLGTVLRPDSPASAPVVAAASAPAAVVSAGVVPAGLVHPVEETLVRFLGCVQSETACRCVTQDGFAVQVELSQCQRTIGQVVTKETMQSKNAYQVMADQAPDTGLIRSVYYRGPVPQDQGIWRNVTEIK